MSPTMGASNAGSHERKTLVSVVEACNHPNCLVLPFSVELIRFAA
jgi:hypothetical protein